jgi:hypothetical protein
VVKCDYPSQDQKQQLKAVRRVGDLPRWSYIQQEQREEQPR